MTATKLLFALVIALCCSFLSANYKQRIYYIDNYCYQPLNKTFYNYYDEQVSPCVAITCTPNNNGLGSYSLSCPDSLSSTVPAGYWGSAYYDDQCNVLQALEVLPVDVCINEGFYSITSDCNAPFNGSILTSYTTENSSCKLDPTPDVYTVGTCKSQNMAYYCPGNFIHGVSKSGGTSSDATITIISAAVSIAAITATLL